MTQHSLVTTWLKMIFQHRGEAREPRSKCYMSLKGAKRSWWCLPGLPRIVEDTKTYLEGSNNVPNFLLQQATRYNIHGNWSPLLENVNKSLLKVVDSETLCEIVRLISSHQKEIKVYTTPFRVDGWPIVTYSLKRNSLIDAAIAELRKRRGCWDEVLIEAQGRYITTLKPLLSARSPFFKELFEDNPKQKSFELSGLYYKTIAFAVLYEHERSEVKLASKEYRPCDSRILTEDNLEELLNTLEGAKKFRMVDVFGEVQRHITHHGEGFIYSRNAQEIKDIATEMNAALLERYCDAFIATNLRKFTLFLSLPTELRISIWSQVASRPRVVLAHKLHESLQTPRHIAMILRVCRDSKAEVEQFWGRPRMGGVKFEVDILWLEARYLPPPISLEEARYCATPAPDADLQFDWGINVLRIIKCCPRLEALYLAIAGDNDEFEYCRRFTNREPTTRAEARNLIEEGAHQRLQHEWLYQGDSPSDYILPKIILICEDEITRLADQHF
ncbi:hypothetical protein V501_00480 [Pseudogymnoascus sp. VKM F-4519 (FW-2642)]|nr:hypothetical protein V501_00480 [Pseudogymnoascus sp. VKM F-4519 (FW-2642)]